MFGITRKSLAVFLSALTMTLVLILVLATTASAGSPIVHRVSVGGPDVCTPPGCDANLSLVAIERADGSVSGQFTDRWGGRNTEMAGYGFHAVVDCLVVDGNEAWVGGVVVRGTAPGGWDLTGWPVVVRVRDNGTSANDPPDQISYPMFVGCIGITCTDQPDLFLWDAPQGQVKVK